ncbi:MAG: type II toxin-antitoxin system RelE/ParE family toxin [bacterium]|nr:type II toxin-antitoxin system RelE/ParE family toxin [bacterium]
MTYSVRVTEPAAAMAERIKDVRVRRTLFKRIAALAEDPELQGKPLRDDLAGYRSVRAVGQKYRIIYRVERGIVTVLVVALGRRKSRSKDDIYELTRKLLRLGLIEIPK